MRRLAVVGALAMVGSAPGWAWSPPKRVAEPKAQACPEIGTGYVRLPGSDVCVKLGGLVQVEGAYNSTARTQR